jgi:hypothetical protein
MTDKRDARVVVSGHGMLNAEVVAVGYQARAEKVVRAASAGLSAEGLPEVETMLNALLAALKQNADKLADPEPIFGLAERVAGELTQKKPDKLTLKSFLTGIADEAKSVTEIASAALSLKDLVTRLF